MLDNVAAMVSVSSSALTLADRKKALRMKTGSNT